MLQTLDVDGDSFTDLLLVGAPMFMGGERDEQGQVYVYKLKVGIPGMCPAAPAPAPACRLRREAHRLSSLLCNQKGQTFEHQFTLKPLSQACCAARSGSCGNKNEPCGARFGTAIAAVSDLNKDGFNDVAIGAPFENDHRGAVYIYHGDGDTLKPKFVQVRRNVFSSSSPVGDSWSSVKRPHQLPHGGLTHLSRHA